MATEKTRHDPDGVRIVPTRDEPGRRRVALLATVLAAVVLGGTVLLLRHPQPEAGLGEGASAPPVEKGPEAKDPFSLPRRPAAPIAAPPRPADHEPASAPVMEVAEPPADLSPEEEQEWWEAWLREGIEARRAAGDTTGLAAFPPPGTNPVKTGIVVPDDFELPPGYVRHYQTTDDGKRLEAILMFSPDRPPLDENGEPIALPEDGIVPPDMAPPGLPVRMLEVPNAPRAADGSQSGTR